MSEDVLRNAEIVRDACIRAVLDGYQQAAMSGLCHEGAFEAAVDAVRMLDLAALLQQGDESEA